MSFFRFLVPILALISTLGLYLIMHQTIIVNSTKKLSQPPIDGINFIRVKQESRVEKKERVKREIPKPKEIKTPPKVSTKIVKPKLNIQNTPKLNIAIPKIDLPINISSGNFLDGVAIEKNLAQNSDIVPILRIPPIYPRRARMFGKEGYVKLKLYISKDGLVENAEILESEPNSIFDKAAINSVYRWKFKPKKVDGVAVEQTGIQTIKFELN
jgi:protein TonB